MVNKDRIVPITNIDFLSMIGTVLTLNGTEYTIVTSRKGVSFDVPSAAVSLANAPIQIADLSAAGNDRTFYFVPDYGFQGFQLYGSAVETTGDEIVPDGISLYSATITDTNRSVVIKQITPKVS